MKISLDWLSDYVEIKASAEQLAEILSRSGFPTEGIEYLDNDSVIDIEVTSNRGDCLSIIGIAREVAAVTDRELKLPQVGFETVSRNINELVSVKIAEPELCGRYTGRIIEGVKTAPAPAWMAKRLEACGLRSVNNVVDATNYAMLETGQPPHGFDYDKISSAAIIVRKAKKGETLVSIDGTKCQLDNEMLIIADSDGPVAIAGVMGGLETEVCSTTKTVLLEDASFDPVTVRSTGRKLALTSESAFRFERIVDIEMIDWASRRTAALIQQVAGGKVVEGIIDVYPEKPQRKTVTLRLSRLKKILGIKVPKDDANAILSRLCFEPKAVSDDTISCSVPSWRSDIYREADLIEEVARIYGYDKIPTERKIRIEVAPVDRRQKASSAVGIFLNGCGFYETINVTFVGKKEAELISGLDAAEHLGVTDVTRKTANLLRSSLVGSLLGILESNYNIGNKPCKIFELANTFIKTKQGHFEATKLTLLCDSDLSFLRGTVEGAIRNINKAGRVEFRPAEICWAGTGAEILIDDKIVGCAGTICEKVAKAFGLEDVGISAAELDFDSLISDESEIVKMKPLPKFPAISRVLSLIVDEQKIWADITATINRKTVKELENIGFEGIYRGKPIEPGKKSVTVSLRFRDEDGTLTHEQVDQFEKNIVAELAGTIGAQLRQA